MNRNSLNIMVSALVGLMSASMARADYSNAVISLNPVAYWPLQESNAAPPLYLATNSGTLGTQANAYYNNALYKHGAGYNVMTLFPGPAAGITSDGNAGAQFNGGTNNDDNSGYLIIPDINHDLDQGGVPFTAEAWVKPGGGDPNDLTGKSYASTEWTSILSKGAGGWYYNVSGDANRHYGLLCFGLNWDKKAHEH
ncbi:MAG: hypothetical protein KGJ60_15265 [Verrucomicrobiota bacterium]|nr:hypothetical protein [Verrucomicrobiota bacterium]